ncbi:hypothetical protein AMJ80_07515 [bacterium SM23_31]|nr:MAG: hypothetical protein AMJ80_07515 [bacterium SM23_31]
MKSIGKLIILMLVSISLISLLGFNQVVQERPDKAERMAAMNAFNQKYDNQWKIRWNNVTGTPASILGHRITKYSGTPEQIARAFLNEENIMLGIDNVERNLELTKTGYSERGGTRLTYTQKYEKKNGVRS